MKKYSYEKKQFTQLLKQLKQSQASGVLYVDSQVNENETSSMALVFRRGEVVYGDWKIKSPEEISRKVLRKLNPKIVSVAFPMITPQLTSDSLREYFLLLIKIKALDWERVEDCLLSQAVYVIEQALPYAGNAQWENNDSLQLSYGEDKHGLSWSHLNRELKERKKQWEALKPEVPSLNAIPQVEVGKINTINNALIRNHLNTYITGQKSIISISQLLAKDPLSIAHSYYNWFRSGWINFGNLNKISSAKSSPPTNSNSGEENPNPNNLPTILSVDDSLIVQISIKRALENDYNVLLSNSAVDALKLLNNNNVDLLLLDVTMPDIDGLHMCRTLRNIPKFKELPIIMVTARDTLVDKVKGQIAGTNHYLTKPFDNEKLRAVIDQFLVTNNSS